MRQEDANSGEAAGEAHLHMGDIREGDNLEVMREMADESFALIYADPPFNTGRTQRRHRVKTVATDKDSGDADRVGFGGRSYRTERLGSLSFADIFDDFLAFLEPRLHEIHRLLTPTGSFFLHLDAREVHYAKVLCDAIFGRDCFQNEIIWAYDFGGRGRKRWPAKHDSILWYTRHPRNYTFHYDAIDRIPYMAPKLAGPKKAARGKTPTDVWWQTIVSPTGREKTGYPTQKPLPMLERIIRVHSSPGDLVLDPFAGSGTTGEAAARLGRRAVLIDRAPEAIAVMRARLAEWIQSGPDPIASPPEVQQPARKRSAESSATRGGSLSARRATKRASD